MDTKAAFETFRGWWFAPEQSDLRLGCAEGWGFKIWLASRAAIEIEPTKKLIGWRMADYTEETTDPEKAKNWAAAVGILPIFEGDINTSLTTSHGIRIKGKTE
jgi:hypothetical protein